MYNVSSSNLIPLCILRVLEEHSDEYHHLTQEEISRFLNLEYNMPVERKAIGRSVEHLRQQLELEIISERDGVWLASRTFEDSELRLLIDAVMSSRYIKPNYTKDLINKLCRLSGKHFSSNVNNLYSINESVKSDNGKLVVFPADNGGELSANKSELPLEHPEHAERNADDRRVVRHICFVIDLSEHFVRRTFSADSDRIHAAATTDHKSVHRSETGDDNKYINDGTENFVLEKRCECILRNVARCHKIFRFENA